jgi:hypothetical protein
MARTLQSPGKSDKPAHARRWASFQGGNRLDRLHQLLVGDAARLNTLPENDPRRRPTLPRLRFLEGGAA